MALFSASVKSDVSDGVFQPGMGVERIIDDVWYRGVLGEVDAELEEATVVYDDGNTEPSVSFDDLRLYCQGDGEGAPNNDGSAGSSSSSCGGCSGSSKSRGSASSISGKEVKAPRVETLRKPLAGLVEDDCEDRNSHATFSVVHHSADTEEAIILNGAENELAAGGGLRALRFIRKKGP